MIIEVWLFFQTSLILDQILSFVKLIYFSFGRVNSPITRTSAKLHHLMISGSLGHLYIKSGESGFMIWGQVNSKTWKCLVNQDPPNFFQIPLSLLIVIKSNLRLLSPHHCHHYHHLDNFFAASTLQSSPPPRPQFPPHSLSQAFSYRDLIMRYRVFQ